jgi:hypothetical protein
LLAQDRGTTIHGNLCSNVSSFDYGAMGYYLDQASQFVTVTDNVAHDIKCAGFLQNFGLNCTISNNVFAYVNENHFTPGSAFSGQTCYPNTGAAVFAAAGASGPTRGAFNFSGNIVHWRNGDLLGGGSSLEASTFTNNVYWNPVYVELPLLHHQRICVRLLSFCLTICVDGWQLYLYVSNITGSLRATSRRLDFLAR